MLNPPEDWIRQAAPELRIIDDELWTRVQSRKAEPSVLPAAQGRKPKRLLSGLMKCKQCGFSMTLNAGKYNCSGHRERGTCTNGKIIAAKTVEKRVLGGIKIHLLSPEAIAEAVRAFHAAADAERHALQVERTPLERELSEIERKLKRAQTMCLEGAIETDELKTISAPLKSRRSEIQSRLAADAAPSVIQLHPGATETYRQLPENLHAAIESEDGEKIRTELRKLIEPVDFIPMDEPGQVPAGSPWQPCGAVGAGSGPESRNPRSEGCGGFVMLGCGSRIWAIPHTCDPLPDVAGPGHGYIRLLLPRGVHPKAPSPGRFSSFATSRSPKCSSRQPRDAGVHCHRFRRGQIIDRDIDNIDPRRLSIERRRILGDRHKSAIGQGFGAPLGRLVHIQRIAMQTMPPHQGQAELRLAVARGRSRLEFGRFACQRPIQRGQPLGERGRGHERLTSPEADGEHEANRRDQTTS